MHKLLYKNFTKLMLDEKKLILHWRNSERVRLCMTNQEIILIEQHLNWLDSLKFHTDCRHYLVYIDDTPFGVINHTHLSVDGENCSGGSYVGDDALIGFGIPMIFYGFYDLFENLKMKSAYACILKSNIRVYMMHKKFFHATDIKNDDKFYYVYFDIHSWEKTKNNLQKLMLTSYRIKNVFFDT